MWIFVDGPCGRAVRDGDALAHARTRSVRVGEPSETRVHALQAIGIVPYWPDHGLRTRAEVVYTRENEWDSRDHELYGPDDDLRTLDEVVSRVRNARGATECRLNGAAIACTADV